MAKSNLHRYSVQEALNIQTGAGGYDIVTGASVSAGVYCAITILTGSVDDGNTSTCAVTTVAADVDLWDTITAIPIPVGTTIYGQWTTVTIPASNTAIVYRKASPSS